MVVVGERGKGGRKRWGTVSSDVNFKSIERVGSSSLHMQYAT